MADALGDNAAIVLVGVFALGTAPAVGAALPEDALAGTDAGVSVLTPAVGLVATGDALVAGVRGVWAIVAGDALGIPAPAVIVLTAGGCSGAVVFEPAAPVVAGAEFGVMVLIVAR